jgi:NTE family protein
MGELKKANLALALSGGSARGLAHIGFLEVLDENKIPIEAIVGTSMGAVVGGIYASGKLKEFKEKIIKLSTSQIVSLFLSSKITRGNVDTKEIEPFISEFLGDKKAEELAIKFVVTATNLKTGEEIFLDKGSMIKNIMASISIPGVFQPVKIKNDLYVDGGVLDPLPQEHAQKIAEKVIAVNAIPQKLIPRKEGTMLEMIGQAVSIMTNEIMNLKLKKEKNILFIQLKTDKISSFDFSKTEQIINIGRKAAKKNLKKIIKFQKN